jgi:hypothetical protein
MHTRPFNHKAFLLKQVAAVIEESYEVQQRKPRYAFVFLLRARLITYVYPLLLSYFTTL